MPVVSKQEVASSPMEAVALIGNDSFLVPAPFGLKDSSFARCLFGRGDGLKANTATRAVVARPETIWTKQRSFVRKKVGHSTTPRIYGSGFRVYGLGFGII